MESNTEAGLVVDVGSLYARFHALSDKRKRRGRRYSLAMVLVVIMLAKMCGEYHPIGIAEWAKHQAEWLVELLKLKREIMPHDSTYRRILGKVVDVEELERVSSAYLSGKKYIGRQVLVAIDGKVLRGTLDDKQNGTYLLAAYLPNEGIVLTEVAFKGKGHEALAAPIPGMNFPPKDLETVQHTNKGHGRMETRTLTVSSQLQGYLDWPYLEQVFKLERRFVSFKTGEVQGETAYGFTSLKRDEITPLHLFDKIRSYWGIESGLHYRRDVTLREDYTRLTKGRAGQAMACLNNLILRILLSKKMFRTILTARRYFSAHPEEALNLFLRL